MLYHKKGKVIRRALKIIWLTIVSVTAFIFAGTLAIQFPQVQTFIGQKLVKVLSDKLDGEITFEKVHLKPFTTLVLKNALIIDKNPASDTRNGKPQIDTFFRAEYVIATFTLDGLLRQESIRIKTAFVDNAQMNLVLEDKADSGDGETHTDNLSRIFRIRSADPDKPKNMNEIFRIKKVEIRDMGFRMLNYQSDRPEYESDGAMDWNNLDVRDIDIKARNLRFKEGKMSGIADHVSFVERSGFQSIEISGEAIVGGGKTIVEELRILDKWSDIDMELFMMSYANTHSFSEFISEVRLEGRIRPSILDFRTISYFAPALKGNNLKASVQGKLEGYVNDFKVENLSVDSKAGGFKGTLNGMMKGLPDVMHTSLSANVRGFLLTTDGLGKFVTEWMPEDSLDISMFGPETVFRLDADVDGLLDQMDINAELDSEDGRLNAQVGIRNVIAQDKPINIFGTVNTDNLDVGRIIGNDIIRQTSLKAGLKAQIGNRKVRSYVTIDSLIVDRMHLNGYDYSGIAGAGTLAEDAFNGTIICNDPSLNFMFQGAFALSNKTQNSRYDFFAVVGHADLNAMNIDKRGISEIQFQTKADFTRTSGGDIFGKIDIADIIAKNNQGRHDIGNISLTSHSNEKKL